MTPNELVNKISVNETHTAIIVCHLVSLLCNAFWLRRRNSAQSVHIGRPIWKCVKSIGKRKRRNEKSTAKATVQIPVSAFVTQIKLGAFWNLTLCTEASVEAGQASKKRTRTCLRYEAIKRLKNNKREFLPTTTRLTNRMNWAESNYTRACSLTRINARTLFAAKTLKINTTTERRAFAHIKLFFIARRDYRPHIHQLDILTFCALVALSHF